MTETAHGAALMERIRSRRAVVGVIGLGYVGLPLALAAVEAGFPVLGFDINPARVEAILAGRQVINYLPPEAVRSALDTGRLDATTDFARLAEADAVILCVPTPVTRNRDPDLSYVRASAASA
ncbi:MAG: NAD(P)-binding domain-containing protein, partial [Phenylobacterium sp.]